MGRVAAICSVLISSGSVIEGTSSPGYLVTCACGHDLRVADSQAGAIVVCPACGASLELPSLSQMRHMPIVAGLVEEPSSIWFRVLAVVGLVVCFGLLAILDNVTGFSWIWLVALACTISGVLAAIMLRPVVYGTVLSGLLLIAGALVSCALAAAREEARRTWCTENLRNLGVSFQTARQFDPGSEQTIRDWIAEQARDPSRSADAP
jgi:hypothetical protein